MSNQQLIIPEAEKQLQTTSEPSTAHLLKIFIENGLNEKNVAAFERLVALRERQEDRDAEKQFNAAFVRLQADLPTIVASTVIPNRGKYERFEDVMHAIGPVLQKHGFCVSFSMKSEDNRVTETCHLRHEAGHSQANSFSVRVGRADSETQADCKAATTAKRNALLNCLNVVIRQDVMQDEESDASLDGSPINWEQAETLREMVKDTKSDEAAFLRFAGAAKFEDIGSGRYDMLFAALQKKLRK